MPKALVVCGDGINCEQETAFAFNLAGATTEIIHINQLLEAPERLSEQQILVLPGGFSFGDEVSSGKILSLKLSQGKLGDTLYEFVKNQKIILGICNGFQTLVKLGLLPNEQLRLQQVSLVHNRQYQFINRWVSLNKELSDSPFLNNLPQSFELPIRHGEGRLVVDSEDTEVALKAERAKALTYEHDVNGSYQNIASLISGNGKIMGLMPHPEAFIRWEQHPNWQSLPQEQKQETPPGLKLLKNIVEAF